VARVHGSRNRAHRPVLARTAADSDTSANPYRRPHRQGLRFRSHRERSHWSVHSGSQTTIRHIRVPCGSIRKRRVHAHRMQGKQLPERSDRSCEAATDYQNIRLGDLKQYLLPVHAENLSCQRGSSYCSKTHRFPQLPQVFRRIYGDLRRPEIMYCRCHNTPLFCSTARLRRKSRFGFMLRACSVG